MPVSGCGYEIFKSIAGWGYTPRLVLVLASQASDQELEDAEARGDSGGAEELDIGFHGMGYWLRMTMMMRRQFVSLSSLVLSHIIIINPLLTKAVAWAKPSQGQAMIGGFGLA
jgi:hypothetical protein